MKKRMNIATLSLIISVLAIILNAPTMIVFMKNQINELKSPKLYLQQDISTFPGLYDITDYAKTTDILRFYLKSVQKPLNVINNNLLLEVKNNKENDYINMNSRIPIKLISYEEYNEVRDLYLPTGAIGGPGGESNLPFLATLRNSPGEEVFGDYVILVDYSKGTVEFDNMSVDYFPISPGEIKHINLIIRFPKPGIYVFQVGLEYWDGERLKTKWLNKNITAIVPKRFRLWERNDNDIKDNNLVYYGFCTFEGKNSYNEIFGYDCIVPKN